VKDNLNNDSPDIDPADMSYDDRKAFFDSLLTIYGRKPVLEALQSHEVKPYRLHLADSNRSADIIDKVTSLAKNRHVEILFHSKRDLSQISKNSKQDQGIALDIQAPGYQPLYQLDAQQQGDLILLDRVTNPQNLGMIIRSVAASPALGLVLPTKGCANIDPLVIKASAGTALKCRIYFCSTTTSATDLLAQQGRKIYGLSSHSAKEISQIAGQTGCVFVLGNETNGLTPEVARACDDQIKIPLANDIESLNVSVAAALVAFRSIF
tara:strand:- start:587 stop:1384 length:798 start_codon:yes stop_codon:yes gene_type:complete